MMRSARHTCGTRRDLVIAAAALAATLAAGCTSGNSSAFNGIDVSGADYGKDFRLLDTEGRTRTLADFKGQAVLLFFGWCAQALTRPQARAFADLTIAMNPRSINPSRTGSRGYRAATSRCQRWPTRRV
jgi:hypothetical protein